MWFKNLTLYRLPAQWAVDTDTLEPQLARHALQNCGASDVRSTGWIAPRPGGALIHSVNRQWLFALGVEEKLLPASVVKRFTRDRVQQIEASEGRRIGRREMRAIQDQMTLELLPRAFVRGRSTSAWIDRDNGWLIVDAASAVKAEEVLDHLRKSIEELPARALKTRLSPAAAMTAWVADGEAPAGFTIDQDLEMRAPDKGSVRYARHSLEGEEIPRHIAAGKVVTRLALTWNDRISFVLDDQLQIKRLSFLDLLKEDNEGQTDDEEERFDLDFTLMTGEANRLIEDLLAGLGGETQTT